MNKKDNVEKVRSKNVTIRFSLIEYKAILKKAKAAETNFSNYCRVIALEGFIYAKANPHDQNEVRLLRQILIEYKTNFSRISNLISKSHPGLHEEIKEVKNKIEKALQKFQL